MFDHMVDITEPICQKLDPHLATMTIFDTSGIEARVTENNQKYANRIIKQLKAFAKANNLDKSYDPYKAAYGSSRISLWKRIFVPIPELNEVRQNGKKHIKSV